MANSPIIFGANGATSLVPGGVNLPGSTSGTLQIQPAASTTSYTLTMPSAQGASTNTLSNDGSGNLSWVTGLPAVGSDGQLIKSMNSSYIQSSYYNNTINYIGNAFAEVNTNGWGTRNFQQTFTVTIASPAVFTVTSTTGFYVGMPISFTTTGALPTGLTASTTYYIFSVNSSTTFEVTATLGGSVVNTSGTQSGTHTSYPLVPINNTSVSLSGLTFSRSTSSPIRGSANFQLVQTNSTVVAGQALAYPFTIDQADEGQVLSAYFDYNASSTFVASSGQTGSDSDLEVCIWDATNSVLIPVNPKVMTANGTNSWSFKGTFQTGTNSTSYVLMIYSPTMNANATGWTFKFTNVYVGRQTSLYGPPMTDWISYTPILTNFGTATNVSVYYKREADTLEVRGYFTSGTLTSGNFQIGIPTGLTIDFTKIANNNSIGVLERLASSAYASASSGPFPVYVNSAVSSITVSASYTAASQTAFTALGNGQASSGDSFAFQFRVPIIGWSSSTLMSNDTDTRVISLNAYKNAGSVTANTTIASWTTVNIDRAGQFNSSTGVYTVGIAGDFWVSFNAATTSGTPLAQIRKNGSLIITGIGSGVRTITQTLLPGLVAGDQITVSLDSSLTLTSTNTDTLLSISRISGPSAINASDSVNGRYFSSSTSISGSLATIVYATKGWDTHGAYNNSTGIWTCPISGKYTFKSYLATSGTFALNNALDMQVQQSGSSSQISEELIDAGGIINQLAVGVVDDFYCLTGDTIKVQVSSGATGPSIVSSNSKNYFSWARVGN